ncbi:MAG: hypothetical protein M1818_006610 [Claussenomyces sp. TS43310]|nr:MAG: hypothetical protein M1818_006955 [Claussenomyces sp. TS43310]KAI9735033.1 MAG: hypothetical protein M1818_006610 [Claussenomyces sp. TS43310]
MAPISSTINVAPSPPSVSDSARARELYKYYQPSRTKPIASESSHSLNASRDATIAGENLVPDENPAVRSNVTSSKVSSPDTALTAFAQLVSWRIGCQRSMISVIDGATQYFIAESTKSIDLIDNTKYGPGDDLWMGCSAVSKAGRLCERTIELPPSSPGQYSAFIVPDLSQDPRFSQLPFVAGPPFLKFYAGTPLITKRGIAIGSLFVVDARPREGLSKDEIRFMGTMAATVMRHLEIVREVEEHRRGMKMSRGLASFVEGRTELVEADVEAEDEGTTVAGQFQADEPMLRPKSRAGSNRSSRANSKADSVSSIGRKEKEYSSALSRAEIAMMSTSQEPSVGEEEDAGVLNRPELPASQAASYDGTSLTVSSPAPDPLESPASQEDSEAFTMKHLFSRAANLIREAFEVDGGSVFYDAQKTFASEYDQEAISEEQLALIESPTSAERPSSNGGTAAADNKGIDNVPGRQSTFRMTSDSRRGVFSRSSIESQKIVETLGFSTPHASSIHGDEVSGTDAFIEFDERSLHAFLRRYPKGKLWTFEEDGAVSSSSDDDGKILVQSLMPGERSQANAQRKRRQARSAAETMILLRLFPGVRQLLFVPLWDSSRSRWLSANFTWSTEPTRILTKQSELAFLTAFGNSVMAECSRIDTEIADQKKGDFIGSISHELRSPLHGILASAEFLGDEITEGFSKGLVETIDSCGRTLLDTINHILDFSKINHFEKNWRRSRRAGSALPRQGHRTAGAGTLALRQSDLPMINLFAEVDISVVCEEVVEGVFAGVFYQNVTASNFDMVPDVRGKMSDPKKHILSSDPIMVNEEPSHHPEVVVILDIDIQDYHFTTQPGAFRRVIMNLLGNALKYTSHGYVKIKLEANDMEDFQPNGDSDAIPRSCVALTISDTGRGISSAFIRSKLFTPFAQENSLSSGTGLGLSIVRSIVALLEGEIQIKSELGQGTGMRYSVFFEEIVTRDLDIIDSCITILLKYHVQDISADKYLEVKVTLPLLRELPKDLSSASTPKSVTSTPREATDVINKLRARVVGKTVTLHGFDNASADALALQADQLLKASILNFLSKWYGLVVVSEGDSADIIVVNEPSSEMVGNLAAPRHSQRRGPAVLALRSHSSRFDRSYTRPTLNPKVGYLAKPIGPLKLARALSQCLDGDALAMTPGPLPAITANSPGSTDLTNVFEELSLSPNGGEVLDNSRMAADSVNARKAIESPTPNAGIEKGQEFPFPTDAARPGVPKNKSMPSDKESFQSINTSNRGPPSLHFASTILTDMEKSAHNLSKEPSTSVPEALIMPAPRLLLVDDNKINLRLLRTYMRKRRYHCIDEAENGLEAVSAVEKKSVGYDIIFMDISMPVLDGFGATRQIRQLERTRHETALARGEALPTPALVIALTGLASSRDQSEAFTSGVDLFLTKPVSFKEVGKLLDNWEANRERDVKTEANSS